MAANIKDVARLSGYSVSAVSQVLNDMPGARLSAAAREKITACAAKLAYRPHPMALALRRRRGYVVTLILPDLSNPSFLDVAEGVQETLEAQGYEAMIQHCGRDPAREQALLTQAVERRTEGAVVLAMNEAKHYREYARRIPLVCLSGIRKTGIGSRIDSVAYDLAEGFYKAADHLIELGHRRIGLLNRSFDRLLVSRRMDGYAKALQKHGIEVEKQMIFEIDGFSTQAGYEFGRDHLDFLRGLTALLVYNDIMAIGLMKAIREAGIKVPDDISIIGCDGIIWGEYSDPPLTTISLPRRTAGQEAARMLLRRIQGHIDKSKGNEVILQTPLIIRNSCKRFGKQMMRYK